MNTEKRIEALEKAVASLQKRLTKHLIQVHITGDSAWNDPKDTTAKEDFAKGLCTNQSQDYES